ncbi:hypothetical protein D7Y13_05880 [Corallococcus praedator]|uniref:Lipoprotein n=1 Tax=Corallococcus praedator TaxID=2316724 RepID=A0ABX9QQK3_9BACT|nr:MULTISPECIES: hypothetical protein [Corallococcus]RKH33390.1 hypothetical protein D7X75_12180 [Corallococcus sp. CA031C]RKI14514.1 hypothetical protein D7Y13_05880 [Corallococcus praedator]
MLTNFIKALSLSAMVAVPLAACGGMEEQQPELQDETAIGQREDAFSGNWNYSWGDTQTSSVDIGTSVNRTCFLSGIGGHMRPVGAFLYSGGTYPAMAGVRKNASGNYELFVQPAAGKHLIAFARCVNTSANRLEVDWSTGQQASSGDKVIGPANGTRQCFLQQVKNLAVDIKDSSGDITGYGWAFDDQANPDEARVFNDGSYWKLVAKPGTHSYPVNYHVTAVCLDATQDLGNWNWMAGNPGTAQINLTNTAGATCGVTGVRGSFQATLGDWADAVSISTTGSQFHLDLANGKRGWAGCMQ